MSEDISKNKTLNAPRPATKKTPAQSVAASAETKLDDGKLDPRIYAALAVASEKKALEPIVLDLNELASFTSYFVILSGINQRQVQAIADGIEEDLKKKLGARPARIEGYRTAEWVLCDYGDFIVHVFEDKQRKFYDLERLWREARIVPLPPELQFEKSADENARVSQHISFTTTADNRHDDE